MLAGFRYLVAVACGSVLLASASTGLALVGDTVQRIESRYGASRNSNRDEFGNEQRGYVYSGYAVVVAFEHGVSVCESFFRAQSARDFTPEELADVLVAYVPSGVHWKPSTTQPWVWTSADGRLRAAHPSHRLQISTVAYANRMAAHNARKNGQ
jgi:hypothetical protein